MESRPDHYSHLLEEINSLNDAAAVRKCREVAGKARQDGDEAFALFFEGEAACLDDDLKKGIELQRQAAAQLPEVAFVHANLAVVLSSAGSVKAALQHLNRALELEPKNLLALSQKSICLCKLYRDSEALEWFDRALAVEPENPHALRNKGVALSRLGRPYDAMSLFNQVLEMNPGDTHALSEKHILEEEMVLRGTPLGWLILWTRKVLVPAIMRALKG